LTVDKLLRFGLTSTVAIKQTFSFPRLAGCFKFYQDSIPVKGISFSAYALRPRVKTSRPFLPFIAAHFPGLGRHWVSLAKELQYPAHFYCLFQRHFGYRYLTHLFLQEAGKNKTVKSHRTQSGVLRTFLRVPFGP
jgi:hypothetical protein